MRRALLVAAAAAAALVPLPRPLVERLYSTGFYAALQPIVTGASNRVPLALLDGLIVVVAGVLLGLVAGAVRSRRAGPLRAAGRLLLSLAAVAAGLYLAFLLLWGGNYRRVPLSAKLDFDRARVSAAAAVRAAQDAVGRLNDLHDAAHRAGWATAGVIDPGLAGAFADTQRLLGATRLATPGRPKLTLLDPYFRRVGVSGMTDPYFLETLLDDSLLPFERPFVVAHEWAHLAGYADEGEANFVGWLTCVRARAPEQYSGWLFLYEELARGLAPRDRDELRRALSDGVRADLGAIAARLERNINPALADAGWRTYDTYLRANRVEAGAASYELVVRLVLGVTFDDNWTPRRR